MSIGGRRFELCALNDITDPGSRGFDLDVGADRPLPSFYWTGETDMRCLREAIAAKLQQAMDRPEKDRDAERIAALISERDKALAAAEKARRKAAKAHAKAEQAQEAIEED